MLNFRYILRLTTAFISRFKALILLGILFGVAMFFILRFLAPALTGSSVERVGVAGRFTAASLPPTILEKIGRGLTKIAEDGSTEPDMASSWETSDKGKTWTFRLKSGIFWQDGKAVVSSAVAYPFSDVAVERPDASTIIFKLQNAYSAFPSVVSKPAFKSGLLGAGEWEVKNLSLVGSYIDEITLEKDGSRIVYKFYPTEEQTKLAFQLGQIDTIEGIFDSTPFSDWKKPLITKNINTGEYVGIFFNTQEGPLADKAIRQALAYAVDKESLGSVRALGPISIDSWAYNSQVKPYDYDPQKAKKVIADYKKSAGIENLAVSLTAPPVLLAHAERIVREWQAVGVDANLQIMSNIPTDYQALLAVFDMPEDPDQYSAWHSTQTATNITRYSNPRIDKLLEDGRTEIDIQTRKEIYFDFQRFLVEDSPAVFLYYPTTYTIKRR